VIAYSSPPDTRGGGEEAIKPVAQDEPDARVGIDEQEVVCPVHQV
jgi:hypothetical protein